LFEPLTKDEIGKLEHGGSALLAPQRRRGSDGAQVVLGRLQSRFDTPDQAGKVSSLRTIKGVDLIDHHVAESVGTVLAPQALVVLTNEQIVQHLVVGHEDVRRRLPHLVLAGDDPGLGHLLGLFTLTTDVEADPNLAFACRIPMDLLSKAPCLIASEGVHRIEDDCFDSSLAWICQNVVENGVEETLRLSRPGAGSH